MSHAQPGLHKTYDLHSFRAEKLSLFRQWEAMLHKVINPEPAADVITLPTRRKLIETAAPIRTPRRALVR
jgi:hypothetical protein